MRLMVDRVLLELVLQYGVPVRLCDVIHLDSSSDVKFSRHLVVRLPHAVFADNGHVGGFVRHVVQCIVAEAADDDDMRRLLMWSRAPLSSDSGESNQCDSVPAPPIDCGVYSRHRSFRLLWSSKRKANSPVLHCHHTQQYNRATSQRRMWLHSCVQYMEADRHNTADQQCATLTWPPTITRDNSGSQRNSRRQQPTHQRLDRYTQHSRRHRQYQPQHPLVAHSLTSTHCLLLHLHDWDQARTRPARCIRCLIGRRCLHLNDSSRTSTHGPPSQLLPLSHSALTADYHCPITVTVTVARVEQRSGEEEEEEEETAVSAAPPVA